MNDAMSLSQRADALEHKMSEELDYIVIKSRIYSMADADFAPPPNAGAMMAQNPKARVLMGDDPRLPKMPKQPTLMDFFKYRLSPGQNHLLFGGVHHFRGRHSRWLRCHSRPPRPLGCSRIVRRWQRVVN